MKNSRRTIFGVVAATLVCAVATTSCTYKSKSSVNPDVSFSKDIIPIFHNSCAINSGCHAGANNGNDFIDLRDSVAYTTIMNKSLVNTSNPNASLLYYEVSAGLMPKEPYNQLSGSQVSLILNWIKQGAKND